MTSVSVVIPFQSEGVRTRGDGASREDIFEWVKARWEALFPDFEIVSAGSGDRSINRSAARNEAFRRSCGDLVIVADADIIFHRRNITEALALIDNGKRWVIGFNRYEQLNGRDTIEILKADPASDVPRPSRPRWSTDQGNAGLLILTREAFEEVNGYDESFKLWSFEDWAFANALSTIVHPLVTIDHYVLHLRHPESPARRQSKALQQSIFDPYHEALGRPDEMLALINSRPGLRP